MPGVSQMAFCTNCGANVSGAFCNQCGTPAAASGGQAPPMQAAPPPAMAQGGVAMPPPPVARRTSPLVWILIVVLGLFVLGFLGVVGTGFFFAHKLHQAGLDTDLM